jgi:hypothetical protein
MSTKYDGKKVYNSMSASQAEFEIRGNKIHKCMSASQVIYEIR